MKARRVVSVFVAAAALLIAGAIGTRMAARQYLKTHYSTTLAAWALLVAIPDDFRKPVVDSSVVNGSTVRLTVTHPYAGHYWIEARPADGILSHVEGSFACEGIDVPLRPIGRVRATRGEAVALGSYVVEAKSVDRALNCHLSLAFDEQVGSLEVEIVNIQSWI